jgi:hypothetical protein
VLAEIPIVLKIAALKVKYFFSLQYTNAPSIIFFDYFINLPSITVSFCNNLQQSKTCITTATLDFLAT